MVLVAGYLKLFPLLFIDFYMCDLFITLGYLGKKTAFSFDWIWA